MAKQPSNKKVFFFTPTGVVEPYCYLQKPDYGNESFKQPRGVYKASLTVPSAQAQPMIDRIVALHEESYAARLEEHKANPPVVQRGKKALVPYEGDLPFIENEDGTVTFKFSGYASYQKDDESFPIVLKVVDSKGKRIEKVPAISGGSKLKLRYSMFDYGWTNVAGASVKLQLDSVMLVELVEYASGGDDWSGQEEDGYEGASGSSKSDWDDKSDPGFQGNEDAADSSDADY
jgi:hypothetical protein